ncbi:MAG: imelysin family protein, partial [Verrucomicrobiota bacterium]
KWEYEYLDSGIGFFSTLATPREQIDQFDDDTAVAPGENYLLEVDHHLVVPSGKKVRALITANDVIHAWWIPAFGTKKDAIPGYINELWFNVDEGKEGLYRGQCAESLTLTLTLLAPPRSAPAQSTTPPNLKSLQTEAAQTYANIVHANYQDALTQAQNLNQSLVSFTQSPSDDTLTKAKEAWINARLPYLQTEVFRFYAGPIDDDDGPEGLLNAWPMDEAYIDYVEGNADAGIINNPADFPDLTASLLAELNEKDGEENISSGFHAIEFLLWGQDLSTDGPGQRPVTDYTTAPNADRRKAFLLAAADLLIENLESLVAEWAPDQDNYRKTFLAADPAESIKSILTGMSMLSGFELSGERLLVAYETKAQEDEHSCFSDTTHNDVVYNALGIANVWNGAYTRNDGSVVSGTGIKDIAQSLNPDLANNLDTKINASVQQSKAIPVPFDQAILGEDDAPGRQSIIVVVTSLEDQAALLVELSKLMGFEVPISEEA